MRHANDDLANAGRAALLDDIIDHRDQALAAFERKALLAYVARVQVAFDTLGAGKLFKNLQTIFVLQRVCSHTLLEALAQPQSLAGTRYVCEFGANLAAIDLLEQRHDVFQLHAPIAGPGQPACKKLGLHVRVGQAKVIAL